MKECLEIRKELLAGTATEEINSLHLTTRSNSSTSSGHRGLAIHREELAPL
jgi:hypothetical protein